MPPSPNLELELPEPVARDRADSDALVTRIRQACADAGGIVSFEQYMNLALYTPELGYYSAPRNRFGEQGDFVTAPEISTLFARSVARQIAQILDQVDGGQVLEVGAGSGVLAHGLLGFLAELGHDAVDYRILERSAGAKGFQRERLARFGDQVQWLDELPESGFKGVIIGNELLDAIAPRCFQVADGQLVELGVVANAAGFAWQPMPRHDDLWQALTDDADFRPLFADMANGYRGEYAPAREAWVNSAAASLQAGALLMLDYGYPRRELYHAQRIEGTLACHYRHRVHGDPFFWPGLQDIGSHVDFSALARAGVEAGLHLHGFTTQAHFLLDSGLLDGLDDPQLDDQRRLQLTSQVQRLTLPGELGEAIKVIALSRGLHEPLLGFKSRDLSNRL